MIGYKISPARQGWIVEYNPGLKGYNKNWITVKYFNKYSLALAYANGELKWQNIQNKQSEEQSRLSWL